MVCQNQSIDESSAPLAKDLRILIRNKIKDGKKDEYTGIFIPSILILLFSIFLFAILIIYA